jgi:hypothetical protein
LQVDSSVGMHLSGQRPCILWTTASPWQALGLSHPGCLLEPRKGTSPYCQNGKDARQLGWEAVSSKNFSWAFATFLCLPINGT